MHDKIMAHNSYLGFVFRWAFAIAAPNLIRKPSTTYFSRGGSDYDGLNDPPPSRREESEEVEDDPLLYWIKCHPWTIRYVLVMSTLTFIMTVAIFITQ